MLPTGLKKVAVFCVLKCQDKYLLLKRAKQPNQGKFVPVGGKIEPFETPQDAVIREVFEETGLVIDTPKFCGILTETSPIDYNWMSYIYTAEIPFSELITCDEGELHWVSAAQLQDLDTPATDWHIYQYIEQGRPFAFNAYFDENMIMIHMHDDLTGEAIA